MREILGWLIIICSWIGGIAFGFYAFIFLGIFGIVNAVTTTPINAAGLAWGIVWVACLAHLAGGVIVWLGTIIGGLLVE